MEKTLKFEDKSPLPLSKEEVDRAGLALTGENPFEREAAIRTLVGWRNSHLPLLRRLYGQLKERLEDAGVPAALSIQRLKGLSAIVKKTRIYQESGLGLGDIPDIGGIRFCFADTDTLRRAKKVVGAFKSASFRPKEDADGSTHHVFECTCSGMMVEVQLCTNRQLRRGLAAETEAIISGKASDAEHFCVMVMDTDRKAVYSRYFSDESEAVDVLSKVEQTLKIQESSLLMLVDTTVKQEKEGTPPDADWLFAISDKIAEALEKQGLSQKDFAKQMGVEEAEVSCWLSGTHNFTIHTLARISAALGVEIIEICKGYLTNKAFGIAESISGELYYRTQISQLGCILDKSPFKIIDLEGVTFISRAAADELCTLAESRNLTLTGASGEAKEMLDLVADSRRADRVRNSESNIDTCGSMEELKRLFSD